MIFDFGYVRAERVQTHTLMTESFWQFSIYAMFGLSASINVALASVLYLLQRCGDSIAGCVHLLLRLDQERRAESDLPGEVAVLDFRKPHGVRVSRSRAYTCTCPY